MPSLHRDTTDHGGLATPASRGALSGLLLTALGAWGALIPFVGPYFHYAFAPDQTWHWTTGRFFLQVLPGVVTVVGGFLLLTARDRVTASFGGWAAVAAGAWFVVGPLLAPIIDGSWLGAPVGGTHKVAVENIGIRYGLGAAIVLFAALAVGRFSVVSVRDVGLAQRRAERKAARETTAAAAPATTTTTATPTEARTTTDATGSTGSTGTTGARAAGDAPTPTPRGGSRRRG